MSNESVLIKGTKFHGDLKLSESDAQFLDKLDRERDSARYARTFGNSSKNSYHTVGNAKCHPNTSSRHDNEYDMYESRQEDGWYYSDYDD